MIKNLPLICSILMTGGILSCSSPSIPRPEGYFRIELPKIDSKKAMFYAGMILKSPYTVLLKT